MGSLRRLEYYLDPSGGLRHLTLTTDVIIKAAEFWAFLRQSGIPTASPDALDADAIFAGQAALPGQPGDTVTIATTNLAHLSRFPGSRTDLGSDPVGILQGRVAGPVVKPRKSGTWL